MSIKVLLEDNVKSYLDVKVNDLEAGNIAMPNQSEFTPNTDNPDTTISVDADGNMILTLTDGLSLQIKNKTGDLLFKFENGKLTSLPLYTAGVLAGTGIVGLSINDAGEIGRTT
jgi:hypothetical protein